MKNNLKILREILWPLLESYETLDEEEGANKISRDDIKCDKHELDFLLDYLKLYNESENNRRRDVESKATIYIGTFAVTISILMSLTKDFVINSVIDNTFSLITYGIVFLIFLIMIHLCRSIIYAIKAVKKRNYSVFGFPKYMILDDYNKKFQIVVDYYNVIIENQKQINLKVDYMTMAQEIFRRAVWTIIALIGLLIINFFKLNEFINKFPYYSINNSLFTIFLLFSFIYFVAKEEE